MSTSTPPKKEKNKEKKKEKKKKRNPLDDFLEELEGYDEGCDKPSPIHSSGF